DGGEESGKGTWNAFQDAPIDDSVGGRGGWVETEDDEVDWSDPFRSAPFDPLPLMKERERQRMSTEEEKMVESESDVDEQRALNRRSFSYEHIDGVGDDASTDSRGRTDGDTTEDTGKENEEHDDGMSTEGETTDGGGTMDDVAGSRPLLDDDGLEEDVDDEEEYETVTSSSCLPLSTTPVPSSQHVIPPSTITFPSSTTVLNQPPSSQSTTPPPPPPPPTTSSAVTFSVPAPPPRMATNPFNPFLVSPMEDPRSTTVTQPSPSLVQYQTKPVLPMGMDPPPTSIISLNDAYHLGQRIVDPSSSSSISYLSSRAPATLPRQSTSLSAVPRPPPSTISPSPLPSHEPTPERRATVVGRRTSSPTSPDRVTFTLQPGSRQCHSSMQYEKMGSSSDDVDTDDSVAGMCGGSHHERGKKDEKRRKEGKKKRRDTHPGHSIVVEKIKPPKKHSTSSKTSGQNASFVNVSFQSEDVDRF
ncbi:hypothetical protein PFISCL1PPCAC_15112, partial [Pristionchus fissidentatus]